MGSRPTRFVIIGNGAAGTYCAEQLRKLDEACEILMIDDEPYTLYNRVSLPRYLRGVLLEQRVYVRDMEWHVKNRIDLRLETKVDQVSFDEKTLHMEPGGEIPYDRLLIATGGRPNPLKAPGAEGAKYFSVTADMVGVGLGLTMNIDVFADTGLETNVGVLTDEFLATNIPEVWAAGDVAEFYDVVSQRHHRMGTWDNSLNHGRHVAKNMLGAKQPYVEVPTYASGMFNSNISVMGVTTEEEPDAESLYEVDYDARNYKRLFFLGDKLVGAILIGKMKGRKKVLELISSRAAIEDRQSVFGLLAMPEAVTKAATPE